MKSEKQKELFLQFEADNWYKRNKAMLADRDPAEDPLLQEVLAVIQEGTKPSILEIGCGNGLRLQFLHKAGYVVCGIDPSAEAISELQKAKIEAYIGTADSLPFSNQYDIVVFGFCLYLCDREDLFKIASEADRVLKDNGTIIILDFYAKTPYANDYHHLEGVKSYKMDYAKLFDWHPQYHTMKQTLLDHGSDNCNDWTAISVIRKKNL